LRARRHPDRGAAYPGSYFKNPVLPDGCRQAAGFLLEQAGARGLRFGKAAVYSGHCNFIINEGGATADDVRTLAAELKRRVLEKFGIGLEEEVIFLPADAPAA
jgi:UDP-N-acetylmuramate dehydrogenase